MKNLTQISIVTVLVGFLATTTMAGGKDPAAVRSLHNKVQGHSNQVSTSNFAKKTETVGTSKKSDTGGKLPSNLKKESTATTDKKLTDQDLKDRGLNMSAKELYAQ